MLLCVCSVYRSASHLWVTLPHMAHIMRYGGTVKSSEQCISTGGPRFMMIHAFPGTWLWLHSRVRLRICRQRHPDVSIAPSQPSTVPRVHKRDCSTCAEEQNRAPLLEPGHMRHGLGSQQDPCMSDGQTVYLTCAGSRRVETNLVGRHPHTKLLE